MNLKLIFLVIILHMTMLCTSSINNRPIIGILSEEFSTNSWMHEKSFIMTTYVKFVEASGARVVPILICRSEEYYRGILNKVNGVLLPGGGDLLTSTGYGRAAKIIFDLAVKMNNKGDYFPIWGTCLGFEMLNFAAAEKMWMKLCSAEDVAMNIDFTEDVKDSRMFSTLSPKLRDKMQSENLTIHIHHWCITPENYTLSGLDRYFRVLAVNRDSKKEAFVSIIEAFEYPFYGVTFHPEKAVYDGSPYAVPIPHTAEAVETSHFFGNFFISEARKNRHTFPSKYEEVRALIYNYDVQRDKNGTDLSAQMYVLRNTEDVCLLSTYG